MPAVTCSGLVPLSSRPGTRTAARTTTSNGGSTRSWPPGPGVARVTWRAPTGPAPRRSGRGHRRTRSEAESGDSDYNHGHTVIPGPQGGVARRDPDAFDREIA